MQSTTLAHSTTEQSSIPSGRAKVSLSETRKPIDNGHGLSSRDRPLVYPIPPTQGGVVESIHGCEVRDPYRSFEVLEAESTQRYIREQNALSRPMLHAHPLREELEAAVEQSYAYERTSCPTLQGDGNYYWLYNPGTSPRDVLVKSKHLKRDFGRPPIPLSNGDGPVLVFDPNQETDTSLYMYSWSPSGRYWTAILQIAGSDWQTIRTIDTVTCEAVEDDLTGAKFTFGATWVYDTGLLYKATINGANDSAYSSRDGDFGIFYHRLNTPQSEDVLVWHGEGMDASSQIVGRPHMMSAKETDSNVRSLMLWDIYRNTNPETETFVIETPRDSANMGLELAKVIRNDKRWLTRGFTGQTTYIGTLSCDRHLFTSTSDGVEAGRILALEGGDWDTSLDLSMTTFIPQHKDGLILQSAHLVDDRILILVYLRDACAEVVFADARTGDSIGKADFKGTRGHATSEHFEVPVPHDELDAQQVGQDTVVIPKHASISAVSCRSDADDFYLAIDTFVAPPYVLSGKVVDDPEGGVDIHIDRLDHGTAPHEDLVCREVLYASHDGVQVPLFINHAKDLDLTKPQPVLLHAYGGFGVCITPSYNPLFASFMRNLRGIVAVACIRGGGEYGKAWHDTAVAENRFICFDDMAYAARYLHNSGISSPALTSIYGISNGGTLVASCANRNPELYASVFCDVGVLDLTRFHKFTLGRLWVAELGDPDNADHISWMHSWSPIHNVTSGVAYPAVLVTTGDHDTRVVPAHSLKYIAQLQNQMPENRNIFIARIYENAGHESGSKSVAQKVEEAVDRLVFLLSTLPRQ